VRFESKSAKLLGSGFGAGGVVTTVQVGGDSQTGFRGSGADEVEDLLIAIEGLAGPVFGNFREESVLNRIPLGSAGGIVSNGDLEVKGIGELRLDFGFPGAATTAVAAAGVGENEQLTGLGVVKGSFTLPPVGDSVSGKSGSVVRNAHDNRTAVGEGLIDAVRDGDANGIRAEVMIVNRPSLLIPTRAIVFEVSDKFALLGIDANDGPLAPPKTLAQIGYVIELEIAVGTGIGSDFLLVEAQRVIHRMQQPGNGVGRDDEAIASEQVGNLVGRAARPLEASDGITGRVMFEKVFDDGDYFGRFFSVGMRPAPARRVRPPEVTSPSSNC